MRKVLLFVLLFSLGLTALLLFQRGSGTPTAPVEDPEPIETQADEPETGTPVEAGQENQGAVDDPGGVQFELAGALVFTGLDPATGKKAYRMDARDVAHQDGGLYNVTGLTFETFEPLTGELRQTVTADTGRLRIVQQRGRTTLGDDGGVSLVGVTVTRHTGSLAPLVFTAPVLVGSLTRESFHCAEGPFRAKGKGLEAEGPTARLEGLEGLFELEDGGTVELLAAGGEQVTFTTPTGGPIRVTQPVEGADAPIEVFATDGTRLEFAGEDEGLRSIDAFETRLIGKQGALGFELESGTASGDVVILRDADRMTGEVARFTMTDEGKLAGFILENEPRAEIVMTGQNGEPLRLDLSGVGPLHVTLGDATEFQLDGAGQLLLSKEGLVLVADGGMSGTTTAAGSTFRASETVVVTQGGNRLTTEAIEASFTKDGAIRLSCLGETHLAATDSEESPLELDAHEQIDMSIQDKAWSVPFAKDITMRFGVEQELHATAGVLRDLDWATRSFKAEGGVTYRSELGEGSALRAVSFGEDHFELYGVPGNLARFELAPHGSAASDPASLQARRINVLGAEELEATGSVHVSVRGQDRSFELDSHTAHLAIGTSLAGEPAPFRIEATLVTNSLVGQPNRTTRIIGRDLAIEGAFLRSDEESVVTRSTVVVKGQVQADVTGDVTLTGAGETFTMAEDGTARLETEPDLKVSTWGRLAGTSHPYEMTADWIEFGDQALEAENPRIFVNAALLPIAPTPGVEPQAAFTEAMAQRLYADEAGLSLEGDVRVEGTDGTGAVLVIESRSLLLAGDVNYVSTGGAWLTAFDSLEAWGGFEVNYAGKARSTGERLLLTEETALLTGSPARAELDEFVFESGRIKIDLERFLIETQAGKLMGRSGEGSRDWTLAYSLMRPFERDGETMLLIRSPVYTEGSLVGRAGWAVCWLDGEAWREYGRATLFGSDTESRPAPEMPVPNQDLLDNPFRRMAANEFWRFVNELYVEREIEVLNDGERTARGDKLFLNLQTSTGWLRGADLQTEVDVRGEGHRVRTRAAWLRFASDGALRADKATITTCNHDDPHYVLETGDLVLAPRTNGEGWRVIATENTLRFKNGFRLPFPPVRGLSLDKDAKVLGIEDDEGNLLAFDTVALASAARFGTTARIGFRTSLGPLGDWIARLFGFEEDNLRGRWVQEIAFLSSRGALFDAGLEFRERDPRKSHDEQFWLKMYGSAISDGDSDRGLVRVDEADRDRQRQWYRARGRYPLSETEWIDLAFSTQSDPGVQAEFFQREFTRYESRDSYLHYRNARGGYYFDARAQARIDSFRTEVEQLPSAGIYKGAAPVAWLGPVPLLYSSNLDVDHLRRRVGTTPADDIWEQGFGDSIFTPADGREVTRVDTTHRIDASLDLETAGLKATPFVEGRFTAWDEGLDASQSPTRAAIRTGVELATTLWHRSESGIVQQVTPSLTIQRDASVRQRDGANLVMDDVDGPIDGTQVEAGLRSGWWKTGTPLRLDVELRGIHRVDRPDGLPDLDQVAALSSFRTEAYGMPVALRHDSRFDLDGDTTSFSRTEFGFSPYDPLLIELAYSRARSELTGAGLYAASTVKSRYRLTNKWEVEASYTNSAVDDHRLGSEVVLRRFGHDFLLELAASEVSGEGGSSIGLRFYPLIGWKPSRLGILEYESPLGY